MKIDSQKPPESQGPARSAQNIQKNAGMEPKAAEVKKPSTGDTVQLSEQSKQLADIKSAVNQLPEIRDARVQEIKKSVDAGTYTVDPQKVAANILKEI